MIGVLVKVDELASPVRLVGDEEVEGIIEFWDVDFIRLTRTGEPNLFIYKHDIKYLWEADDQ